jgi:opacity protein-like surface antigen
VYSKYTIKGPDNKYVTNNKKYTKAVDFGLGLGATYNLTDNAFVQARYTLGLTNVFKDDFNESKNGNIQLSIGYRF